MKSAFKWLLGLLIIGVVIFVGLLVLLPMVLDPNDYKDKISQLVHEKSGYQIEIPGDIKLQVTFGLDVLFSLGEIRVQSGPDFPDTILLSSEEARIDLSLMPLLREKRLAVQGLALHGVYCNLIRDKAGRENWRSPTAPPPSSGETVPDTPSPAEGKQGNVPELELGGLDVSRVTVRFEDQQQGKRFELKDFSLHTGPVRKGQSFHLESRFTLVSSAKSNNALSAATSLDSDVTLDLAARTIGLANLKLDSTVQAFAMQDTKLALSADAFIDLDKKNISLSPLSLSSGELSLTGKVDVKDFSSPAFQGMLTIPEFSLRDFLDKNRLQQPRWKDDSALRQVGFSCGFGGDMKEVTVSDIKVVLDGAKGGGSFTVTDLKQPAYDLQLHIDLLDLDRYAVEPAKVVVPKSDGEKAAAKAEAKGVDELVVQPLFPVEKIKGLNFVLDLGADSMKVRGAHLSQVKLAARGKDGLLVLKPLGAKLYGGSIAAEGSLDVRGPAPKLTVKEDLSHVQVGPLLRDMTGKEEVTGTAILSLELSTSGNSKEELTRGANGRMKLALEDGVIRKLHLLQVIRQAKALYEKEPVASTAGDEPTGFARISGSGVIKAGVLHNKDLQAASDLLKVTGSGKVDFVSQYVDYLLNVTLLRGLDRNQESGKADYSKMVIPYRINGEFSDLKEEADVAALIKGAAQTLLVNELEKQLLKKEEGTKKEGEKKDTTQKLLEQGLKSLFGN